MPSKTTTSILVCLAEELAEAIQACTKAIRHGPDSHHPSRMKTNRQDLSRELGDVLALIDLASTAGLIEPKLMAKSCEKKKKHPFYGIGSRQF